MSTYYKFGRKMYKKPRPKCQVQNVDKPWLIINQSNRDNLSFGHAFIYQ